MSSQEKTERTASRDSKKRQNTCESKSAKKSGGSGKRPRREKPIQNDVMLHGSRMGLLVWRNNVGVARHKDGSVVVYGLCPGSSDLICLTPVEITQEMVGRTLGVFTAIECKAESGGRLSPEQKNFIARVIDAGGFAVTARSPDDLQQVREQIARPISPARVRGLKASTLLPQGVAGDTNDDAGMEA